ncbi:hypothetical protein GCM10010965_16020 [Caldalkalibacillus thermarum]|uniref:sensor domain-containing protein n=1 Tax=Caldalkalibacillus thermarum TaxID=296745 RepID=UPI001663DD00|nr:EAL domain-containing protein [Caldalkalibacillus thermarum]GGK24043.1 hypothetical protein GCM10010965_16020 [Caldalkalibacillus thermarum]
MAKKSNQSAPSLQLVNKEMEETLIKSGQQVLTVLENIQGGYIILNRHWEFLYLNPAIEQLFNIDRFNLIGKNFWDAFPELKDTKFYQAYTRPGDKQARQFREWYAPLNRWFEVTVSSSQDIVAIYFRDLSEQQGTQVMIHHAVHDGAGDKQYRLFKGDMNVDQLKHIVLEHDLPHALENNQLRVYYQPQIDNTTGTICGMEALIRWEHPTLGLVSPSEFLPVAEANGLITAIGQWVLQTACQQVKTWQQQEGRPIHVSVNFSALQFQQDNLAGIVQQVLDTTGLEPASLRVEITESAMMTNLEQTAATLKQLKSRGIQLAVDDFGMYYSSLQYLKHFPLDLIKIDRSFIMDMHNQHKDQEIVKTIIELGHRLGLKVCAEGVEYEEQFTLLKDFGCDEAQGFLFSRPMPSEEIERLLHTTPRM